MAGQYLTRDNDTLDLICWRYYGRQAEAVEAVLVANPHLADLGPVLPAGKLIDLPDLPEPKAKEEVSFWD